MATAPNLDRILVRPFQTPLARAVVFVTAIFVGGTVGYHVLEDASWWDAFFMTVITVTTVGYEEEVPHDRAHDQHEIFCGYGRMGRAVVEELQRAGRDVVVVERSADRVRALQEAGVPVVSGDATSEATCSWRISRGPGVSSHVSMTTHTTCTPS